MATTAWAMGFAFCFALSLLLSVTGIGAPALLCFFGLTGLLTVCYPHLVLHANLKNAILWLYPAWAFLSAGWSINPDRTVHSGLLLVPAFITGIALGGIADRRAVNAGAAASMTLYMAYSIAVSSAVGFADTGSGGTALTGLSTGKNFFGHIAAISLLMVPGLFSYARTQYGKLFVSLAFVGLIVCGYGLIGSHATGSLLAAIIGGATYPAVLLFRRLTWQWRIVILAATVGVLTLYLSFGQELRDLAFQTVLAKFNKDTSLTGRTTLWAFADQLIADHRILGYGYNSFWNVANPDAWTVWRMMGMQPNSGFNFHNTFREIMIDNGMIGLIIYFTTFGFAFVRMTMRSLRSGELVDAVRLSFIVYFIVRLPVETTGIGGPSVDSILLLAFLSVPLGRAKPHAVPEMRRLRPFFRNKPQDLIMHQGLALRSIDG